VHTRGTAVRAVLTVQRGPQSAIKNYTVLMGQRQGEAAHVRDADTPRHRPTAHG